MTSPVPDDEAHAAAERPVLTRVARRVRPEVVAHGGVGGRFPGNSRAAMEAAFEVHPDRIECDIQASADNDLVLVHDDELTLPDGRRRPVRTIPTAELRRLLPGLLLLDELVAMDGGRIPLMLDIKSPGYEDLLIAAIRRYDLAARSSVSGTWGPTLRKIHLVFPEMRVGLSTGHWGGGAPTRPLRFVASMLLRGILPPPLLAAMILTGATEANLFHRVISRPLVAAIHATGRGVNAWTVDRPPEIRRMIALGVDGIISNFPARVDAVLEEAGLG